MNNTAWLVMNDAAIAARYAQQLIGASLMAERLERIGSLTLEEWNDQLIVLSGRPRRKSPALHACVHAILYAAARGFVM